MEVSETPLAVFLRGRMWELGLNQVVLSSRSKLDQGLLSKVLGSVVNSLTIESVLKLAIGLSVHPQTLFELLGREDLHELVVKGYGLDGVDHQS